MKKRRKRQRFITKHNIRGKLIYTLIPVVILIIVLILFFTNKILYNSNMKKTEEIIQDECGTIHVRLDSMKKNAITCANVATADINRVYQEMQDPSVDNISFIAVRNNILTALDYDRRCFDDVDTILFMDINGNMAYSGISAAPKRDEVWTELVEKIPKMGLAVCKQFPMENRDYIEPEESVVTFGKRILNMDTGKILGYLFLNVKESTISGIFPNDGSEVLKRDFFLLNENGKVVSALDKEMLQEELEEEFLEKLESSGNGNYRYTDEKGMYLYVAKDIPRLSMTLVSRLSIKELTRDIRTASTAIILIGTLGILAAAILIVLLARRITGPIKELTAAAEHMQNGDFTTRCGVKSSDEIGVLSEAFNVMALKIEKLIFQVKEEQKSKRRYELALIQAQIKPHFLYNTLDLIYVFCMSDKAKEGAKLTKSLADYYRTSLSSGRDIITLREELKNVRNYLYIQRERYYDIVDFSIDYDPEIEEYTIVKMTLQPLVENAIYHGLKEQKKKGNIWITGRMREEDIELVVADDGVGMSQEKISEISQTLDHSDHFGLRSADNRIKLYFGEEYGISIYSELQKGTRIEIRIPKNREVKND